MYYQLKLKKDFNDVALSRKVENQHVTLAYKPSSMIQEILNSYIGIEFPIEVIGYARSTTNESYMASIPKEVPYFNKAIPHITISVSEDGYPVNSKNLVFNEIEPFTVIGIVERVDW